MAHPATRFFQPGILAGTLAAVAIGALAVGTVAVGTAGAGTSDTDTGRTSGTTTLTDQAWTQIAATAGEACQVDRIHADWSAKGEPKVKGWAEDVTDAEAKAAYECIRPKLAERFSGSDEQGAADYPSWPIYNSTPYGSSTHGGRFVNNFGNATGAAYGRFEEAGPMPVGTVLVKDSFGINKKGEVKAGPLFTMVKMEQGWNADSRDWRYALLFPNGKLMGATGGKNSDKLKFCIDCHVAAEAYDSLFFLPEEYRAK